jgi:hypothetical protein
MREATWAIYMMLAAALGGCSGGSGGGSNADGESESAEDAGADGGGEREAGSDGGEMLECGGVQAQPVPPNGTDEGTTAGLTDHFRGSCVGGTAPDVLYVFRAPGSLDWLSISLLGSAYDTALYAYVNGCTAAEEIACNDDRDGSTLQSYAEVLDQPAGDYFIVVDGLDTSGGPYALTVLGTVTAGQPCDPDLTFLRCAAGTVCANRGAGFSCLPALDCADGVDADGDGTTDEDSASCDGPPAVTCPSDPSTAVGTTAAVSGSATDDVRVVLTWWSVAAGPTGSSAQLSPVFGDDAAILPRLAGPYTLRYTAADDLGQLGACETTLSATVAEGLRVELVWNVGVTEETDVTDVDLHLLHPTAPSWFEALDCYYANCEGGGPLWGPGGTSDDPTLDVDDLAGRGPEAITIPSPEQGGDYRIGAHHYSDNGFGPAAAIVNLYCYGALAQSFGPVTLYGSNPDDSMNDFWKVADVSFGATSCTVTELDDGAGGPLIVTGANAAASR